MVSYETSRVWCYDDPDCFEEDEELWVVHTKAWRPRPLSYETPNDLWFFLYVQIEGVERLIWGRINQIDFDKRCFLSFEDIDKMGILKG